MTRATNVRIMAATNRDLRDLIKQGLFREDLYYRINVIHLVVPPLRDRREDIPLLVEHFLGRFTQKGDPTVAGQAYGQGNGNGRHFSPVRAMSPDALDALCAYAWPGNVRQVENIVERLIVTGRHEVVQLSDLPSDIRNQGNGAAQVHPARERRRTVADDLFRQLVEDRQSFWQVVYPLYMNREITRSNVRELVHKGLEEARGNYKIVLKLFNMESGDYKRFLNFLRKHDCQLPFKEYR
jgi:DNA-binding NtrC family response regulator